MDPCVKELAKLLNQPTDLILEYYLHSKKQLEVGLTYKICLDSHQESTDGLIRALFKDEPNLRLVDDAKVIGQAAGKMLLWADDELLISTKGGYRKKIIINKDLSLEERMNILHNQIPFSFTKKAVDVHVQLIKPGLLRNMSERYYGSAEQNLNASKMLLRDDFWHYYLDEYNLSFETSQVDFEAKCARLYHRLKLWGLNLALDEALSKEALDKAFTHHSPFFEHYQYWLFRKYWTEALTNQDLMNKIDQEVFVLEAKLES